MLLLLAIIPFAGLLFTSQAFSTDYHCQHQCKTEGSCSVKKIGKTCYYTYVDEKRTWIENKELCLSQNMTMVKPPEEMLHKKPELLELGLQDQNVWLGGKAEDLDKWTYVNGVSLDETYSNWIPKTQEGQPDRHCGVMSHSKHGGSDVTRLHQDNCLSNHRFICRFSDWQNVRSLYVSESSTNWYKARSRCRQINGKLYYLNRGESMLTAKNKLTSSPNQTLFVGLTNKMWRWQDGGEILYKNWQNGGPISRNRDCLMLNLKNGFYNENDCNAKVHAACEKGAEIQTAETTTTMLKHLPAADVATSDAVVAEENTKAPLTENGSIMSMIIIFASSFGICLLVLLVIGIVCVCQAINRHNRNSLVDGSIYAEIPDLPIRCKGAKPARPLKQENSYSEGHPHGKMKSCSEIKQTPMQETAMEPLKVDPNDDYLLPSKVADMSKKENAYIDMSGKPEKAKKQPENSQENGKISQKDDGGYVDMASCKSE